MVNEGGAILGILLTGALSCLLGCDPSEDRVQELTNRGAAHKQLSAAKSVIQTRFIDLVYSQDGDPAHKLDLYLPEGKKNPSLLIYIHGGAWIGGDKAQYVGLAKRFSEMDGIAVAVVNYRLSSTPAIKNPVHAEDVSESYKWLVDNSSSYGFDPKQIFVMGHSAGAHNAGMLATGPFLTNAGVKPENLPKGFVGLEGIYDPQALNADYPSYKDWFLLKALGEQKDWPAGSPSLRPVVLHTPWLVVHSTEDQLVNVKQAEGFAQHLKNSGVSVMLFEKPLGLHDEVWENLERPKDETAKQIVKFVRDPAHAFGIHSD